VTAAIWLVPLLTALATHAQSLALPRPPSALHPAIARKHPELVRDRDRLAREADQLPSAMDAFNRTCARVAVGSDTDRWCRENLPPLEARADRYCSDMRRLLEAYRATIDTALSDTTSARRRAIGWLKALQERFRAEAAGFENWERDAEHGLRQAWQQLAQVPAATVATAVLDATTTAYVRRVDDVIARIERSRSVRHVRAPDVRQYVVQMRRALEAKTPREAKRVLLEMLERERIAVKNAGAAASHAVSLEIGRVDPPEDTGEAAALTAYEGVLTATDLALNHRVAAVQRLTRFMGVASLLPSIADAVFLVWEGLVAGANIEALQRLNDLARQELAAAQATLKGAVEQTGELQRIRRDIHDQIEKVCR
jgi:hypothetical protein